MRMPSASASSRSPWIPAPGCCSPRPERSSRSAWPTTRSSATHRSCSWTAPPPRMPTRGSEPDIDESALAILQYTSGSTGTPEGRHGLARQPGREPARDQRRGAAWRPSRAIVGWLPHYHDMGLIGLILQPIFCGARLDPDVAVPVPAPAGAVAADDQRVPGDPHRRARLRLRAVHADRHRRAARRARPLERRGGHHRRRAGADRDAAMRSPTASRAAGFRRRGLHPGLRHGRDHAARHRPPRRRLRRRRSS